MRDWILDVSGDLPGNVCLFRGEKNFIFDADMAYCGQRLVKNIEKALGEKTLDGIFLTHSHYDHISGIPMLKKRWPEAVVYAASYAATVMRKDSALKKMRQMNIAAAEEREEALKKEERKAAVSAIDAGALEYRDEDLKADRELEDGMILDMGDYQVTAIATPGHTRDCMSYMIERKGYKEKLLLCSETTGAPAGGTFIPVALVSFSAAVEAIDRLEALQPDGLLFSHYGYEKACREIWEEMRKAYRLAKERFLRELRSGKTEEEMIKDLETYYWTEAVRKYQPHKAFAENTSYMLKVVQKEFGQNDKDGTKQEGE